MSRLLAAAAGESGGEPWLVGQLAWTAFECCIDWDMANAGERLRPRPANAHNQRIWWCVGKLGIPWKKLDALRTWGMLAEHENKTVGGPQSVLPSSAAGEAVALVSEVLLRVGRRWLTIGQQETLNDLVAFRNLPPYGSAVLECLKQMACDGRYASPDDVALDVLVRRYSRPHTPEEHAISSEVAYYAAVRATNQSPYSTRDGGLAWIDYAWKLTAGTDSDLRLAQLLKLRAICYLARGDPKTAGVALREARMRARKDPMVMNMVLNRESAVLAKTGRIREATELARRVLAEVTEPDDRTLVARRKQRLGLVLVSAEQYDEANQLLDEALREHSRDHNIAYVDIIESMIYLRIRLGKPGDLEQGMLYSRSLEDVAKRLGLERHHSVAMGAQAAITRLR